MVLEQLITNVKIKPLSLTHTIYKNDHSPKHKRNNDNILEETVGNHRKKISNIRFVNDLLECTQKVFHCLKDIVSQLQKCKVKSYDKIVSKYTLYQELMFEMFSWKKCLQL